MRRLRGWMPKSDTALRPCFWILCAAFGLGILLGQLAGRSLGVEQQDALASYLRRYAALCASAERPVQSALSAVLTYLRGPAAAFLLEGVAAMAYLAAELYGLFCRLVGLRTSVGLTHGRACGQKRRGEEYCLDYALYHDRKRVTGNMPRRNLWQVC